MASDVREAAILTLSRDTGASPDTIEIVREKHQGDVAVVAATFRRASGRLVHGFVGLRRVDGSGWRAGDGGWSSGPRDVPSDVIWESSGGWGSVTPPRGVAGGWVNGAGARRVKVTDPNGRIEEDTVESGVAIIIWEGDFDVSRATAELLGEDGRVVRTGPMRPAR